ncbi:MAG: PAS domain-containing protein [Alphaproteobacteria bacterium]|nr:PAS domain-containing protein [Alphaproteobacteria bacterium]
MGAVAGGRRVRALRAGFAILLAVACGVVLLLGSVEAAVAVAVLGVAVLVVAPRTAALRELAALEEVAAAGEAGAALPADLPGSAGRMARALTRRLAEAEALATAGRRATARTAEIIDAAPNGVLVVGADGRIEHANGALRALLGSERELVGLQPVEALAAVEILEALVEAERVGTAPPRDFVHGDLDLSVSAHAMSSGVLAVVRDVSRERQVERARTDFVANVSHELRTPITAIQGFTETLADTPDVPPELLRLVQPIQRNVHRLRQLFEDLLTLHQIEARRRELPREDLELAPLLAEAVAPAVDQAAARQQGFELSCEPGLRALGNRQALSAIVGNLVGNACKYTPAGGQIRVEAHAAPDGVCIDVSDTGVGIPKTAQGRVFERFYRVDGGRARQIGGAGLGLAIVKHLAQASGARVTVRSEEGVGSTFTVHLPPAPRDRAARTWEDTLRR